MFHYLFDSESFFTDKLPFEDELLDLETAESYSDISNNTVTINDN